MLQLRFQPFPVLQTTRLTLDQIKSEDNQDLFRMRSDLRVMRFLHRPIAKELPDADELIKKVTDGHLNNETITWGIRLKDQTQLIGTVGFHRIEADKELAELGYLLDPAYWRGGIISEAITAALDYARTVMLVKVFEAKVDPQNEGSNAVMRKFGFQEFDFIKGDFEFEGQLCDTSLFLLKST